VRFTSYIRADGETSILDEDGWDEHLNDVLPYASRDQNHVDVNTYTTPVLKIFEKEDAAAEVDDAAANESPIPVLPTNFDVC
jgi:hypothetical protein